MKTGTAKKFQSQRLFHAFTFAANLNAFQGMRQDGQLVLRFVQLWRKIDLKFYFFAVFVSNLISNCVIDAILLVNQSVVLRLGVLLSFICLMHKSFHLTVQFGISSLGFVPEIEHEVSLSSKNKNCHSPILRLVLKLLTQHFDLIAAVHPRN